MPTNETLSGGRGPEGLTPGVRLGPYEILGRLGAGGMGEVYRARDTRLGRTVAIKVLPRQLAADPTLRERLEREARAVSSLSHPNICALYDIGSQKGVDFLVMEHLDGETLGRRLAAGPLPLEAALGICRDIARALEYAHQHGILHRDLKPGNVQILPGGMAKLLDFGLAKIVDPEPGSLSTSQSPTRPIAGTRAGALLGTPAYMSPEQARGLAMDRRTDLWSFGCILFEVLSGRALFRRATVSDTLVAVLERAPDWSALSRLTPVGIQRLLHRCLEKDPERRLRDAGDARLEIEEALAGLPGTGWPRTRAHVNRAVLAGLTVAAVVAAILLFALRERPATRIRTLPALRQVTFAPGVEEFPAWSPDGARLAYSAESGGVRKIFVQDVDGGAARQVTHGEYDDIQPAWSPDGSGLLFVRSQAPGLKIEPGNVFGEYSGGDVWSVHPSSGAERRLLREASHPTYSPDGRSIAVDASWVGARRIWLVDDQGRNPVQLTSDPSEAVSHVRPRWSPEAGRVTFQVIERARFGLRVVDVATRRVVPVTDDLFQNYMPVWSSSGDFLYFSSYRSGGLNIWRVAIAADGRPAGRPEQVTTGPGQDVQLAMSPDGSRLAFSILKQNADLWRLPVDPLSGQITGPPEAVLATTREESRGAWSPDGGRIAFNSDRGDAMNIWIRDLRDGSDHPVTEGLGGDFQPTWSPDGNRLVFFSSRSGNADIWSVDPDGARLSQLTHGPGNDVNPFFSPDGSRIAYQSDEGGRSEVWVMNADGAGARALTRVGVSDHFLRWTPDGAWVVFHCICGGNLRAMRVPLDGGEPDTLPEIRGGAHMSLAPDGTRIMDVSGHKVLWVSPLAGGAPEQVFQFEDPGVRIDYPVWSPDGRWILFDRFRPEGGDIWLLTNLQPD